MKITDALIAEHGAFFITLDFMEGVLPKLNTVTEVQLLGALLERLLHSHGETEENLLLVMLDHTLEEKGTRDRMHQAHLEIDVRIKEIQSATQLAQARRLLKAQSPQHANISNTKNRPFFLWQKKR